MAARDRTKIYGPSLADLAKDLRIPSKYRIISGFANLCDQGVKPDEIRLGTAAAGMP